MIQKLEPRSTVYTKVCMQVSAELSNTGLLSQRDVAAETVPEGA